MFAFKAPLRRVARIVIAILTIMLALGLVAIVLVIAIPCGLALLFYIVLSNQSDTKASKHVWRQNFPQNTAW